MAVEEVGVELVETALTFAPWLVDVPVLGRILVVIAPTGGNDIKALEKLQAAAKKKETDRATRTKRNARYVLRASDAMKCVEQSLANGGFLLSFGKALLNTVLGRSAGASAPDIVIDRIFTCIESKVLSQKNPRVKVDRSFYHRPARGHGHGRKAQPEPE